MKLDKIHLFVGIHMFLANMMLYTYQNVVILIMNSGIVFTHLFGVNFLTDLYAKEIVIYEKNT